MVSPLSLESVRRCARVTLLFFALPVGVAAQLNPTQRARIEHQLRVRLPCLGCHTIDGRGGAIGPDLSAVGARRNGEQIRQMLQDPQQAVPGTVMPRVPMSEETRQSLVKYLSQLRSTPSSPRSQLQRATIDPRAQGAVLYAQRCAVCHGAAGRGDGPNSQYLQPKPAVHADARSMSTRTDDRLYDGIFAGGVALGVSAAMPAFGETLAPDQIRSLVRYIRELCKCRQPPWANGR